MRNFNQAFLLAVIVGALPVLSFLSGCGGGGGAASDVTVTVKSSQGGDDNEDSNSEIDPVPTNGGTSGGVGTLQGQVVFQGSPPQLDLIVKAGSPETLVKNSAVCAAVDIPNEKLIVGADRGVQNVFVYLPKAPKGFQEPVPQEAVLFDQRGCRFFPHVLIMRTGQTVKILSDDPILHNTHTYPKRTTGFNQGIGAGNRMGVPMVYRKPEKSPVEVKCDFHSWMRAYHLPLDHPFAAVTNADGTFEIKNLPAGTHKFRVWHEGATGKFLSRNLSVKIKPNDVTKVEIPYPAAKFAWNARPATKSIKITLLSK
jgi:hypothetical protein